ncbi:uncharacterized protein LY89DRAFT_778996 [Mollisia scopiformis]|uniref:Uncharacterized protein n=1 Tax=Mollisia scopiformis TaxID=149040 RepID=A0A194XMU0_MOLSC|nr:uncharacterized protein LY89DRAFT_778996 [Mollisia scopiformis]KUJ21473.1 hypothetical protein LY89DRAFT_778996 [Mollisia scopiformis]
MNERLPTTLTRVLPTPSLAMTEGQATATASNSSPSDSLSEPDAATQLDNIFIELAEVTDMTRAQLEHLVMMKGFGATTESLLRKMATTPTKSSHFPTSSSTSQWSKRDAVDHEGNLSTGHVNAEAHISGRSNKSKSPSDSRNTTHIPEFSFKMLGNGHIAISTSHTLDQGTAKSDHQTVGIPLYKIWRKHLLHISQHLKRFSSILNSSTVFFNQTDDSSSPHINSIFRPFHEIEAEIDNEPHVKNKDYFAFTQENIDKSKVLEWYSAYSMMRAPDFPQYEEWATFYDDFFDNPDFRCSLSRTDCGIPNDIDHVLLHYPGLENRTIARRLWFTARMQHEIHQLLYAIRVIIFRNIQGKIPKIIKHFTQQQDKKAVANCKTLHDFIDFLVEMAINTAVGMASSFIPPLMYEGNVLSSLASRNLLSWKTNDYTEMIAPKDSKWHTQQPANDDDKHHTTKSPQYQFLDPLINYVKALPVQEYKKHNRDHPQSHVDAAYIEEEDERITGGIDNDSLCGGFEGGQQDNNDKNIEKLRASLPKNLDKMEKEMDHFFNLTTKGVFVGQGGPSLWSMVMASAHWKDIMAKLDDGEGRRDNFEKHLMKHTIGKVLGEDNNYIKCFHFPDRHEAEQHKKFTMETPGRKEQWWTTAYRKSIFFPDYEKDPSLMCQVAHWYAATNLHSHENAFVGLNSLETFENHTYGFKLRDSLQEAWEYYKLYGNEIDKIDWMSWALGSGDLTTFHLPVCVSDHLGPYDLNPSFNLLYTEHLKEIRFPGSCGGYRAELLAAFLKAANADPTSMLYANFNELFYDIIPRQANFALLSLFSHYCVWCEANIHMPEGGGVAGYRSPRPGRNKDCDFIQNATLGMNEEEANIWFCENHGNHTVFQDEDDHYGIRNRHPQAHKGRCEGWLKVNKADRQKQQKETKEVMQTQNETRILAGLKSQILAGLPCMADFLGAADLLNSTYSLNFTQPLNGTEFFNATAESGCTIWTSELAEEGKP